MTVEEYLRGEIPGYLFEESVLKKAALSPIFAKPTAMKAIALEDVVEDNAADEEFVRSLTYATSTLYYSAAGAFSGGSRSEQVGDVHASLSGFIITQADRAYYRSMGDKLRGDIGADIDETLQETGGMFDATCLRNPKLARRHGIDKV